MLVGSKDHASRDEKVRHQCFSAPVFAGQQRHRHLGASEVNLPAPKARDVTNNKHPVGLTAASAFSGVHSAFGITSRVSAMLAELAGGVKNFVRRRFRLRVSASTREFEIEGSEKFVEKYWAELKPLLSDARSADAPQPTVPPNQAPDSIQQVNSELPDSFGQYFSMFQNPNQVAQALIAGYYYQEKVETRLSLQQE